METALIVILVGVLILLATSYRFNNQLNYIRKVVEIMSDSIASVELIRLLAQAVVNAQESEEDAEEARDSALAQFNDLTSKVTLDEDTKALVAKALGNSVAAPPVDAPPIDANGNGIPDDQETPQTETPVSPDDTGAEGSES